MVRHGFSDCDDVCADVEGEVSGEAAEAAEAGLKIGLKADLKADLKATAAHVFDGVAGEVRGEADFDGEAALGGGVSEAGAIWMLMITDRDSFDEADGVDEADLV